jgi:very-short-patch-repair endonuclease
MNGSGNTQRERHLLALANRQHGLLRHDQLIAGGLTQDMIDNRLRSHRLTRVAACVYAFGHTALRDHGHWLAALWGCGPSTSLSHVSASDYFGWTAFTPGTPVHLSTVRSIKSRDAVTVHRVTVLDRVDRHDFHPFRVTTMPRTLVDLADVMDWPAYRALADRLPHLDVARIRAAQARAGRRAGRGRVTRLIEADDAHTKSEFERRFLRFLEAHRLPRPDDLNEPLAGHKADCVYRGAKLVVELDGRAYHRRRSRMRADRARDTDYQLVGFRIMRLVWDDLHPDSAAQTADRLGRLLALTVQPVP